MLHTKNCIICFKPATSWTGHVHKTDGDILAGWCDNHKNSSNKSTHHFISVKKNCIGCFGRFTKDMGTQLLNE
jgi:hypothetical protein